MKKFLKIFGFFALSAILVCGCVSSKETDYYFNTQTNATLQTSFDEEVYVWENFVISTNRVENVR